MIMRKICHEVTTNGTWDQDRTWIENHHMRKTLAVFYCHSHDLCCLHWKGKHFLSGEANERSRFYDKFYSWCILSMWKYLRKRFEEWPKNNRSLKAILFPSPLLSLHQTWHKSLEWLHENKMNHAVQLKWTTTKSIIYLIKELPHTIWRTLPRARTRENTLARIVETLSEK